MQNPTTLTIKDPLQVTEYHVQLVMGPAEQVLLEKVFAGPFAANEVVTKNVQSDGLLPAAWPIGPDLKFNVWGVTPSGNTPVSHSDVFTLVIPGPVLTLQ